MLEKSSFHSLSNPQESSDSSSALTKRSFDLLAAVLGLLFLSPFLGFITLAIKRDSPGPVFYRGKRATRLSPKETRDHSRNIVPVGYSMPKTFDTLKFRAMYERPESYQGAKHALSVPLSEVEGLSKGSPPIDDR